MVESLSYKVGKFGDSRGRKHCRDFISRLYGDKNFKCVIFVWEDAFLGLCQALDDYKDDTLDWFVEAFLEIRIFSTKEEALKAKVDYFGR